MKLWIDCTSGEYEIIKISNDHYDKDDWKSKLYMEFVRMFKRVYRDGAVQSKCGRMVIDSSIVISNIQRVVDLIDEKDDDINNGAWWYTFQEVLAAAFRGITTSCSNGAVDPYDDCYKPISEIERLVAVCHGELEISKGTTLSEDQMFKLLVKVKTCKEHLIPQYVKNSTVWDKIVEWRK